VRNAASLSERLRNDGQHRKAERDCDSDMQNVAQIFIPKVAHE
jgi:hypothetical protein